MVMGSLREEAEVAIIGGGPGGYVAAIRAADLGKEVVLIDERDRLGGVCLIEGCIPSKVLINAVEVAQSARDAEKLGLSFKEVKVDLDKLRTWIRLSPEELKAVAAVFADKLNKANGPVTVMVPLNGWSSADLPGNDTHDPAEDLLFIEVLRQKTKSNVQIVEINANMEDPEFADAVVEYALKIF